MFNEKTAVWVREGDRIPPTVDIAQGRYEASTRTDNQHARWTDSLQFLLLALARPS